MKTAATSLIIKALCLLLILLQTNARAQATHSTTVSTGKVKGRVLDFDTQNRKFILEGEGIKQIVEVDVDGNYEINLPPGIYRVITQEPIKDNKGIPSDSIFRRASFRVSANTVIVINLSSLRDRVYCTRFGKVLQVIVNDGAEEVEYPRPKYDTLWLPGSTRKPRDVVVEYCGKRKLRGSTLYKNATLTHDKITITAAYLQLNDNAFLLHARGREVIIEDESKMITVRETKVNLLTGIMKNRPQLKR